MMHIVKKLKIIAWQDLCFSLNIIVKLIHKNDLINIEQKVVHYSKE